MNMIESFEKMIRKLDDNIKRTRATLTDYEAQKAAAEEMLSNARKASAQMDLVEKAKPK